jgi:hypothetical protein
MRGMTCRINYVMYKLSVIRSIPSRSESLCGSSRQALRAGTNTPPQPKLRKAAEHTPSRSLYTPSK